MMDNNHYDIIVIGGGPAGTSSAIFLSRRGYRVLLLDQSRFPRDKVCGEFISPAADAILEELGVLSSIEAGSPMRLNGLTISSYQRESFSVDYPPLPASGRIMTSLSLPRILLDHLLVKQAVNAGVEVREEHKVTDFIFDGGNVSGVEGLDGTKTPFRFTSRIVVDAGGRNAVSLRRFNLKRNGSRKSKIALAAHWENVSLPRNHCYMHISPPGYTGIAPVGERKANVVLVVDSAVLKGRERDAFYREAVLGNSLRRDLLRGGEMAEKARGVDSLAYSVGRPDCGGLVLVGDAMGFIDPFTGEGIYLSLRSSQIAAGVIDSAIRRGDCSREGLSEYERVREREFRKKFLLSKILQRLIYHPALCNRVVRTLGENPGLAEMLVGVIGDYFPAAEVVSLKFLARLIIKGCGPENKGPFFKGVRPQPTRD